MKNLLLSLSIVAVSIVNGTVFAAHETEEVKYYEKKSLLNEDNVWLPNLGINIEKTSSDLDKIYFPDEKTCLLVNIKDHQYYFHDFLSGETKKFEELNNVGKIVFNKENNKILLLNDTDLFELSSDGILKKIKNLLEPIQTNAVLTMSQSINKPARYTEEYRGFEIVDDLAFFYHNDHILIYKAENFNFLKSIKVSRGIKPLEFHFLRSSIDNSLLYALFKYQYTAGYSLTTRSRRGKTWRLISLVDNSSNSEIYTSLSSIPRGHFPLNSIYSSNWPKDEYSNLPF